METALKYINVYKNEYMPEYKGGNLIINKTSCCKVSKEVAFLISFLPERAEKQEYLDCLSSLEITDCESVFNKLYNLGVLEEKQDLSFWRRIKRILKSIFNPQIPVISSHIQEKCMNLKVFKKYRISENTLLKFASVFIILLFVSGFFIMRASNPGSFASHFAGLDLLLLVCVVGFGIVIHELGHSFMCYYCGIGFRPICFSVYLIYPVMFTNVSGVDELNLRQRILINIAGLFAQGIYMFLLVFLFLVTGYPVILLCTQLLFIMFYFNLHPLMRTDGYWFFRDVLHFIEDGRIGRLVNNIFYVCYFLFSAYLLYRGFVIVKSIVFYFVDFKEIKLDIRLLENLFYIYLLIFLFRAIKNRYLEFYRRFIRKKENNHNSNEDANIQI